MPDLANSGLLGKYTVHGMLGQGTFGVVYMCKVKKTGEECAVKMVDKVETPVDKIMEEATFLKRMDHPNVIRCLDVIDEKCFVCIVMEKLSGGDLIGGMQAHWKNIGKIPPLSSVHIIKQMAISLAYLHSCNLVHRDVKGDNYLCDKPEIVDPTTRIVLTDFGTVGECPPDQRLHEKCGTKLYWAPEFYSKDYHLKVDTWAMGVVSYGLINGRFPFRDENEVRTKVVKLPDGLFPDAVDLIQSMLRKEEVARLSTEECAKHPWVTQDKNAPSPPPPMDRQQSPRQASEVGEEAIVREIGANENVQDRRFELVERLQDVYDKATTSTNTHLEAFTRDRFHVKDRQVKGVAHHFEWWSEAKVNEEFGDVKLNRRASVVDNNMKSERVPTEVVASMLKEHGIDVSKFGTGEAKPLEQLASEVETGMARMMLDATQHKKLVRVVDFVGVRICAPNSDTKFLMETGERFSDGRKRNILRLPGTKQEPHENVMQTAERVLADYVTIQGMTVKFDGTREMFEEEEESPSYPGVHTVYHKQIIVGKVSRRLSNPSQSVSVVYTKTGSMMESTKTGAEMSGVDSSNKTKFFQWMNEKECVRKGIRYKAPEHGKQVSGLVHAPIVMDAEELRRQLKQGGVDVAKFTGKGDVKTFKALHAEVSRGDCSIVLESDGRVRRIVDLMVLRLHHPTKGVLVQTEITRPDTGKEPLVRLPFAMRRPDENQFLAARRIIVSHLRIEDQWVTMDKGVRLEEEETEDKAYPGLITVHRKRHVFANFEKPTDATI